MNQHHQKAISDTVHHQISSKHTYQEALIIKDCMRVKCYRWIIKDHHQCMSQDLTRLLSAMAGSPNRLFFSLMKQ